MVTKYMKHEIKTQGKMMAIIYSVLAMTTMLTLVLFWLQKFSQHPFFEGIYYIVCGIYGISVIVSAVVSFIYLCYHFYHTMYSQQGYLTHTLPLKTTDILHVKILVSCGFLFLTVVFCVLSFAALGALNEGLSAGELVNVVMQVLSEAGEELGVSSAAAMLLILLIVIAGCTSSLLMFFAGSSVGQLFPHSKGVWGIAAGIGIYYISEVISAGIAVAVFCLAYINMPEKMKFAWFAAGMIIMLLFWTVVYYIVCRKILLKHLNLE